MSEGLHVFEQGLVLCIGHCGGEPVVEILAQGVVGGIVCVTCCSLCLLCQYQLLAQTFGILFGLVESSGSIAHLLQ